MMIFHGYAGSSRPSQSMQRWLDRGYAVFSMTDRGFHESCGSVASRLAARAACDDGFLRLLDTRYEVRDAQIFAGLLADEDRGHPGPDRRDRRLLRWRALDGARRAEEPDHASRRHLAPWKSPDGKAMELAVAIPSIPWTDLAYSLVPNGSTLDYLKDSSYYGRFGVMKESWVNLLYTLGLTAGEGNYAPAGQTASADLTGWKACSTPVSRMTAGPMPRRSSTTSRPITPRITSTTRSSPPRSTSPPASPTTSSRSTRRPASTTGPGPSTRTAGSACSSDRTAATCVA